MVYLCISVFVCRVIRIGIRHSSLQSIHLIIYHSTILALLLNILELKDSESIIERNSDIQNQAYGGDVS